MPKAAIGRREKGTQATVTHRCRAALLHRASRERKRGLKPPRKEIPIHTHNLCFLGFGNVNRTLVRLLEDRAQDLAVPPTNSTQPSPAKNREANPQPQNVDDWLQAARADVLFEATSLNVENGQPAIDHIRAALAHGAHAITANKGPIVHTYCELRDLAKARGKKYLIESTVMDGVPIFSLFDQLPDLVAVS